MISITHYHRDALTIPRFMNHSAHAQEIGRSHSPRALYNRYFTRTFISLVLRCNCCTAVFRLLCLLPESSRASAKGSASRAKDLVKGARGQCHDTVLGELHRGMVALKSSDLSSRHLHRGWTAGHALQRGGHGAPEGRAGAWPTARAQAQESADKQCARTRQLPLSQNS